VHGNSTNNIAKNFPRQLLKKAEQEIPLLQQHSHLMMANKTETCSAKQQREDE
jgi:hypothetical protein